MNKILSLACFILATSSPTFAALIDRDSGLIYDDVLDITWLQDANFSKTSGHNSTGLLTWSEAIEWAEDLTYLDATNWRLPSVGEPQIVGYNQSTSELGHMFYNNLGLTASQSVAQNQGPFVNLKTYRYWFDESLSSSEQYAWSMEMWKGYQTTRLKAETAFAWAVHDGDIGNPNFVTSVPIPSSLYFFASGITGLLITKKKIIK